MILNNKEILGKLKNYTEQHFAHEEEYMESIQHPELEIQNVHIISNNFIFRSFYPCSVGGTDRGGSKGTGKRNGALYALS